MSTTLIARVFRRRNIFYFVCFVLLALWLAHQVHAYYIYKRYGLRWFDEALPSPAEVAGQQKSRMSVQYPLGCSALLSARCRPPIPGRPACSRCAGITLTRALRIRRGGAGREAAPHEQVALRLQRLPGVCQAYGRAFEARAQCPFSLPGAWGAALVLSAR